MSKYALVPDGFTLKKVSKAEEDALKDHRKHEDVKALLDNSNTPLIIGAGAFLVFTPFLMKAILDKLQEEGVTIPDVVYNNLQTHLPYSPPALILKGLGGVPGAWDAFLKKDEELEQTVKGWFGLGNGDNGDPGVVKGGKGR